MALLTPPDSVVLLDVADRIATVTLNRPAARNALSSEVLSLLPRLIEQASSDDEVDVVVLTGADPAFCAGLDLKELGSTGGNIRTASETSKSPEVSAPGDNDMPRTSRRGPFPHMDKPLIGAVNGVAITGGLELALNCDFLVASENAKFGDTHTRVGVMPGWGLTVLLPQAIGIRRAREMSFSGNFLSAHEALHFGLVNHVVPHEELMPFVRRLALDMCGNDQAGVRQIRRTYAEIHADEDAWAIEARDGRLWQKQHFSPDAVASRRTAIQKRGRTQ
jgi:enoyl-CoA hydratase